jgi:predicted protein tyrosine phosphatase
MPMILVTPLSAVEATIRDYRPSHLVTLLSPEHMIETPDGVPQERHLRVGVHDVMEVGESDHAPAAHHIDSLLEFGRGWTADAPMLVHCWAGVSRSTAAAYILLCDRLGAGCENEIARMLRTRAPHACPNTLMVRVADEALQRRGRMIAAIESIGHGTIVAEGGRVELPLTLPTP